jgi:hypothetical protein
MKRAITIAAVGLAIVGVILFCARRSPAAHQSIHFTGLTNGIVGALTPVFATLTTNHAATIQRWLAAGTNGAVFTITNQQAYAIWLFPLGRIRTEEATPMSDETPLLNAPNFSGIHLSPGQVANVQVALLPHHAPWRLQLYYRRDFSASSFFKMLLDSLQAWPTGKRVQAQSYMVESDLIDR